MPDEADRLRARDEVLELLYWLEGEGFRAHATVDGMLKFLAFSEAEVRDTLETLAARGDVAEHDGMFQLTETGRREAARRFADDFAPLLKQGHGECNDPTCDCHENPDAAAECHARIHEHELH